MSSLVRHLDALKLYLAATPEHFGADVADEQRADVASFSLRLDLDFCWRRPSRGAQDQIEESFEFGFSLRIAMQGSGSATGSPEKLAAEMEEVMLDIPALTDSDRAQDRIERGRNLVDADMELAANIPLPQGRPLGFRMGERAPEEGRTAPVARAKQFVESLHLACRHLAVAVGETKEHHQGKLDDNARPLRQPDRHGLIHYAACAGSPEARDRRAAAVESVSRR